MDVHKHNSRTNISDSYLGNSKVVWLHLLRCENIHATVPVNENPMNMPKMKKAY